MQDLLPHKNIKANKLFLILVIIIVIIMAIIVSISIFLIKKNTREYFNKKTIYIVYADKSLKQSEITPNQNKLKSLGGSGDIYKYKDYYYLLVSVYLLKEDAEEIVSNIKTTYKKAAILSLKIVEISRNNKKIITENIYALNYFKFLNSFNVNFTNKKIKYLARIVTDRELASYILEQRLILDNIIKNFNFDDNNLLKTISIYQNMSFLYLDKFLSSFFESTKKSSLVCDLAVNMSILQFELTNNL